MESVEAKCKVFSCTFLSSSGSMPANVRLENDDTNSASTNWQIQSKLDNLKGWEETVRYKCATGALMMR